MKGKIFRLRNWILLVESIRNLEITSVLDSERKNVLILQ